MEVLLDWEIGSNFGWGLLGLNIFFHWANDDSLVPLAGSTIGSECLAMVDPLRLSVVSDAIVRSNDAQEKLSRLRKQGAVMPESIVIEPVGHGMPPPELQGELNVGRAIF
jgi:hypothetical protein